MLYLGSQWCWGLSWAEWPSQCSHGGERERERWSGREPRYNWQVSPLESSTGLSSRHRACAPPPPPVPAPAATWENTFIVVPALFSHKSGPSHRTHHFLLGISWKHHLVPPPRSHPAVLHEAILIFLVREKHNCSFTSPGQLVQQVTTTHSVNYYVNNSEWWWRIWYLIFSIWIFWN